MSKLSALDSMFLLIENQEVPAHVAGLQIYKLPKGAGSSWLTSMMEELRQHPPSPPFNLKLKQSLTGGMQMVEDTEFDIEYHLRHTVLPKPGTEEQLRNVVARLHANLLDRDMPLWEFHLIEGLENRRFAFYIKIHHALCDGATFSKWMTQSTSTSATRVKVKPIWQGSGVRPSQTHRPWLESLQKSGDSVKAVKDFGLGLGQLTGKLLRQRYLKGDDHVALPLSAPQTAFNTRFSGARSLAFTSFPLEDLKAMGRPYGATLNDVVLTICDAALHRYLEEQAQVPEKPLVAMVPVNLRRGGDSAEGNHVASLQVKLGDDKQDLLSRLKSVSESMKTAKELYSGVPAAASQGYSLLAAGLAAAGMSLKLEGIMPPPLNLIVSNVPGPRETRYFNGAKMEATFPVSGIAPMAALNVTVYSYDGTLYFGLISGRRAIPHLQDLKLCIEEIYEELQQTVFPGGITVE